MKSLTKLEQQVFSELDPDEATFLDEINMRVEKLRGVLSSLQQKGLILIDKKGSLPGREGETAVWIRH